MNKTAIAKPAAPFGRPRSLQGGSTLIEIMVAVLVVAVGVVGMAALQIQTLRNTQSSAQRSQASVMAYSMFETIRATIDINATSPVTEILQSFNLNKTCTRQTGSNLTLTQLWINSVKQTVGGNINDDSTCAQISCSNRTCTVTIFWNDELGSGKRGTNDSDDLRNFRYQASASF